jgi:phage-related protein
MVAAARTGPFTRSDSRKRYSLHVFQKKSKHGIATPKPDLDIIRERLKVAEQLVKEMRDA